MADKPLSHPQQRLLKKAPEVWSDLPGGVGCTNATLENLQRRGLVELRIDPAQRCTFFAGWQWRKTPAKEPRNG